MLGDSISDCKHGGKRFEEQNLQFWQHTLNLYLIFYLCEIIFNHPSDSANIK